MTEKEALNRMAAYCSESEHCRLDVRDKLLRQELDEGAIARILNRLEKENFIDNERYARSFINDKLRFGKWGKVKIKRTLRLKQIPEEVIAKGLEEMDQKEYIWILKEVLLKKKKTIQTTNEYELKAKLTQFALGKGFEMEDIEKCV
jgi:regulatory protein